MPRGEPGSVDELASSIREHGLLVPVLIEPDGAVRGGVRRLAALKALGRRETECLIVPPGTDASLVQLVDNLQRKDMSPLEEANAFRRILDRTGWKQVRLARELGISEARISLALNLLSAPREVLEAVERGEESPYAVKCAFSRTGRRDGRAEEMERRLRSRSAPRRCPRGAAGGPVRARFPGVCVRVPRRRLPEGVRARVFADRVELAITLAEDVFPLGRLASPGGLAESLQAALGPPEGDAIASLVNALQEARAKALEAEGAV